MERAAEADRYRRCRRTSSTRSPCPRPPAGRAHSCSPAAVALVWNARCRHPRGASSGAAKPRRARPRSLARPGVHVHQRHRDAGDRRQASRATQHPTMPAPTTAIRSPTSGAASHSAFTAVSTVPASTARRAGTRSGHRRHGRGRHHEPVLMRVQAEDRPSKQVGGPGLHLADVEVPVLHRPGEVSRPGRARASLRRWLCRHRRRGTPGISVPRLMPDHRVRTSTSRRPRLGQRLASRSLAQPGRTTQKAVARDGQA